MTLRSLIKPLRNLIALVALTTAFSANADSAQLQVFRQQLKQLESLGMTDAANSIRDLIKHMEEEEAESPAGLSATPQENVRSSYFSENNQDNLESCSAAGDIQFDSICTAAMLRYQDYLVAMSNNSPKSTQDELWRRHAETAKVYMHSLSQSGHGLNPNTPTLK